MFYNFGKIVPKSCTKHELNSVEGGAM